MLEHRAEIRVVFAADGQEALQVAQAQPPDVVLIDLTTPTTNGLDALEAIKHDERTAKAPLVLLAPLAFTPEQQADLFHRWTVLLEQSGLAPADMMAEVQGWLSRLLRHPTVSP